MKIKPGKTVAFGGLIWIVGFLWGMVVFMTPVLKELPPLPLFSRYPAISFPLLVVFPLLAYWCAPKSVTNPAVGAALPPVGFIYAGINALLDVLFLVGVFKSGWSYFSFLSVWVAYALLVVAAQLSLRRLVARVR